MRPIVLTSSFVAAALILAACNTPKADQEASAAPAATAADGKPDVICATREVTGSRMPVRECHTAAEWADINKRGQDSLGVEAQRGYSGSGGN